MKMIGTKPLEEIITLTLQTPFLKNEHNGVSLLIVGKPETGKTTILFKYGNIKHVAYYDEITQKKLIDDFLPMVKSGEKKTLVIPDLINCIDKQRSTREQFLNVIKSGIDDTGITAISTFHKHLNLRELGLNRVLHGLRFNLITAITGNDFRYIKKRMVETGLLSRFLPFTFDYPISIVKKIFDIINQNNDDNSRITTKIKQRPVIVKDVPELFKQLEIVSTALGHEYGGYGFRAQHNLQRLAKANAVINGRNIVTQEDIDKVLWLSNWINYKFNVIDGGQNV